MSDIIVKIRLSTSNVVTHAAIVHVIDADTGAILDNYVKDASGCNAKPALNEALRRAIDRVRRKYGPVGVLYDVERPEWVNEQFISEG